ncbi:uncharacterized protein EHS24_008893 [Apiotrichum porosum]|uniref:Uncharacterized protein n=1 Tax=Apiotrichum porosum TaxID=105984 RepID=A0A427XNL8_9TREE|nr:uncharacterized protein EHS24_008893 [Apiotrichum porosum]RSH80317.1 hypothetical protein EHS24_008893 [Apiotrichum porosum]
MGLFDHHNEQYQQYSNPSHPEHEAKLSHELIAGAAAYEAAKAYENHNAKNGQPSSHAQAKQLLAGFAGAFIDREFESKGLNFLDKEKAKHQAQQQAEQHAGNQW